MAEILNLERTLCPHCGEILDGDTNENLDEKLMKLHEETEIALQIILQHGKFETGTYVAQDDWGRIWKKKQEPLKRFDEVKK